MSSNLDNQVRAIIKFVESVYSPGKVEVDVDSLGKPIILFYFEEIDDEYMYNPFHHDPDFLKRQMFSREIRQSIENYLGIKTHGLQPNGQSLQFWTDFEDHPIHILAMYLY